jgi:hypothetical protein
LEWPGTNGVGQEVPRRAAQASFLVELGRSEVDRIGQSGEQLVLILFDGDIDGRPRGDSISLAQRFDRPLGGLLGLAAEFQL